MKNILFISLFLIQLSFGDSSGQSDAQLYQHMRMPPQISGEYGAYHC